MHVGARAGLAWVCVNPSIYHAFVSAVEPPLLRSSFNVLPPLLLLRFALWKHDTLFRPLSDLPRRHPPGLSMNKRKRTPPCDPACNCKGCIVRAWRVVPARFYSLACAGRIHCVPFSDGAVSGALPPSLASNAKLSCTRPCGAYHTQHSLPLASRHRTRCTLPTLCGIRYDGKAVNFYSMACTLWTLAFYPR